MGDAQKEVSGLTSKTSQMVSASKKLTAGLLIVGTGAAFLGKKFLEQAASFEQSQIAFTTMLGSAEKANALLKELADFAKRTPFELKGVEMAAKQILAMGGNTKDLLPELKALGDVSAGTGAPLERLALNFNQVRLQGKLTGRELRDFAVNGVPLISELAKNLGVAETEIAGMVSAGTIGFAEVSEAFTTMTSEGGRFANLMDEQSKTLEGQVSNLKDEFNLLGREIGKELLPTAKRMVGFIIHDILPAISNFVKWVKKNREVVIALAIGIMVVMIPAFVSWAIAAGAAAVATILAIGPLLLLGIAVAALAYLVIKNWDWIKEKTLALWNYIKDTFQRMHDFLVTIGNRIKDAMIKPFSEAWDKIQDVVNKIRDALDFTKRHSPSVIDLVERGVGQVNKAMEGLEFNTNLSPRLTAAAIMPQRSGNNLTSVTVNLPGAIISSEGAAQEIAEIIGDNIVKKVQANIRT